MIPSRDRIGQIATYASWLENRLGANVRGMWVPERVWEQNMASDLAAAGVDYLILDDSHFKNAGLNEDELHGYYLTEDDGRVVRVFPGSERLRYVIPFGAPEDTIDYLRSASPSGMPTPSRFLPTTARNSALARDAQERVRGRLAGPVVRSAGRKPELDPHDHAVRSDRQRAAAGQGLFAGRKLPRND